MKTLRALLPEELRVVAVGGWLAGRAIVRNFLRASLTILGILIGVSAVVLVTALAAGARGKVSDQIANLGSNLLIIQPQSSAASGAATVGSGYRMTEEDGRTILREAVSVKDLAPLLRASAQIAAGENNADSSVLGTTLGFFPVRNFHVRRGATWSEADEATKAKVCVLGASTAKKLFGTDEAAVGQGIRIGKHIFRVTGVLEAKGEAPMGGDQDDVVLMPIGSMRGRIVRTSPGFVMFMLASATSADTTQRAVAQVDAILRQRHHITGDRKPDFVIRTQAEFQAMQGAIYGLLTVLLVCIAAVSLVVGGIGVMNIMLVSVTERTREIGIRMAIGARAADIMVQFLVEAVLLALLGGLLGALFGVAAITLLGETLGWPMKLDPTALGLAVAVSALTGIAFGFLPARRAAKLDPIVALRHE